MNGFTWSRLSARTGLLLILLLLSSLGGTSVHADDAIQVRGLRTGVDAERTRLVLDLSRDGVHWQVPERSDRAVTVELAALSLAPGVKTALRDVGRIASARLSASAGAGLSLELTFARDSEVSIFTLSDPPRWVLDVRPKVPTRPEKNEPSEKGAPPLPAGSPAPAAPGRPADDGSDEAPTGGAGSSGSEARSPEAPAPVPPAPEAVAEPPELAPLPTVELAPLPERKGPRIVVIDAGHGGEDPGATGPGLREKDVCLDVARRLHRVLSAQGGIHPVLTRSRDVLVPLRQRMQLAEEVEADLFVSIHVNASGAPEAHGVEVFFLSLQGASDEASRELARLENDALSAGSAEPTGLDTDLPFTLSLRQSDTLLRSSRAAETVLDSFVADQLAQNRGVRQASFVVLKSVAVPSILVELGFASSEIDREKLKLEAHRQALADALARGIGRYFQDFAPIRGER